MTRKSHSITIRDVARQADVSVATVSRFINRNAPVSAEVAERISKVMTELNYVPHAAARHLATRRTRSIGLLLTTINYDFFSPLLSGLEKVVAENHHNLLVATYRADLRKEYPPPVGPHNTDGVVIFADAVKEDQLAQWHRMNFPMVLVHRTPPPHLNIPYVTVENKAASRRIVDHLIEVHGRRHIVFTRGLVDHEDSHWREMGYKDALEAHGIAYDPKLVVNGEFDREVTYREMKTFLSNNHPVFDAVFASDDDSALGVIRALQDVGMSVPDQVSVVGFDDQHFSCILPLPLTTVRAPTEAVGRAAGQQILNMILGEPAEQKILLPTEVVIRQSCGCSARKSMPKEVIAQKR
ncbi:MAG: LacI family DNA-binding transcriptional regulator [Anaerolineales bacterium]|nr:LacI family DNA-binding transcriptional regulator [Anaerolineales bacterium]